MWAEESAGNRRGSCKQEPPALLCHQKEVLPGLPLASPLPAVNEPKTPHLLKKASGRLLVLVPPCFQEAAIQNCPNIRNWIPSTKRWSNLIKLYKHFTSVTGKSPSLTHQPSSPKLLGTRTIVTHFVLHATLPDPAWMFCGIQGYHQKLSFFSNASLSLIFSFMPCLKPGCFIKTSLPLSPLPSFLTYPMSLGVWKWGTVLLCSRYRDERLSFLL